MSMFDALTISASALSAERQRSEISATNLANVDTTHTAAGTGPFRRKEIVFATSSSASFRHAMAGFGGSARQPGTVRIAEVADDPAPPVMRYEPGHPDADKEGYVAYPAINPVQEMVDLMSSVRAYQLNASAVNASKQLIQQSIDILKS